MYLSRMANSKYFPRTRGVQAIACISAFWLVAIGFASDQFQADIKRDPAQVLGAVSCAKCHEAEMKQWQGTPHYATFETLHRKPEAKQIVKNLGLSSVKRNELCVRCHYTEQLVRDRVRVVSGVSCESCHGAGKDWVPLHNDYGGVNITKEQETTEHAQQRIADSIAAGMNNPSNLYLIARQCLACHTTPDERLVNEGGHPAGSGQFEFVAWSQGMVRHKFLSGGGTNAVSTPERLRMMYVVGMMADLEASFRATSRASVKNTFGIASAQRAARLKRKLYDVAQLIDNEHLDRALDAALAVPLKLGRSEQLLSAAAEIGAAAEAFASSAKGEELTAIDEFLPDPSQYK